MRAVQVSDSDPVQEPPRLALLRDPLESRYVCHWTLLWKKYLILLQFRMTLRYNCGYGCDGTPLV